MSYSSLTHQCFHSVIENPTKHCMMEKKSQNWPLSLDLPQTRTQLVGWKYQKRIGGRGDKPRAALSIGIGSKYKMGWGRAVEKKQHQHPSIKSTPVQRGPSGTMGLADSGCSPLSLYACEFCVYTCLNVFSCTCMC